MILNNVICAVSVSMAALFSSPAAVMHVLREGKQYYTISSTYKFLL